MLSIASNYTLSSVNAVSATAGRSQDSSSTSTELASTTDTVSLSPTAQAAALQQQGLTVKEIASTMGLTSAAVDSYLDITTASSSGGGVHGGGPSAGGPSHSSAAKTNAASSEPAASGTAVVSKSLTAVGEFHG